MRQCARIHSFQRSGVWLEAEETQKTTSVVCAQSPVAGLRLQTVRSKRSTVLIRRARAWPGSPRALSGRLGRVASFLRKVGVEINFEGRGRRRTRKMSIKAILF